MKILALDTSTDLGSIAIVQDGKLLAERISRAPMKHLSWLSPAIREILSETHLSFENIDAIATGIGPGSFTGVRLALATARSLAQVRRIPLYGISSLDALAHSALPCSGTILSCIDARRGELFAGIYRGSETKFAQLGDYLCLPKEQILSRALGHSGPFLVIGETNPDRSFFLQHLRNSHQAEPNQGTVRASSIAALAHERRHELSGDLYSVGPLYIRPSSAELEREKKRTQR